MKGDFTRDTFDPLKHFSRVLQQQGRVTVDADANEQAAILTRYLRRLTRDLVGPFAAPAGSAGGFHLNTDAEGVFTIGPGSYYVDGILVENDATNCTYRNQPDYPVPQADPLLTALEADAASGLGFGIYLDVWERHVTSLEDDSIREKALGGPDTCTRAKVVWQVKALPITPEMQKEFSAAEQKYQAAVTPLLAQKAQLEKQFAAATAPDAQSSLLRQIMVIDEQLIPLLRGSFLPVHETVLGHLTGLSKSRLAARVDPGRKTEDACVTPPSSKYRGAENQLYRVEIHRGSRDATGNATSPTFKWSRDNGSTAAAWLATNGNDLTVGSGRGFAAGNWIELLDDDAELLGLPGTLVRLAKVEADTLTVEAGTTLPPRSADAKHPKVRRWDHVATDALALADDSAVPVTESPAAATADNVVWTDLEDGVQVQFVAGGDYRTGDYWLIPARVATGSVEWPQADDLNPQPLPPRGIEHHYALIGAVGRSNAATTVMDFRCEFRPLFYGVTAAQQKPGAKGFANLRATAPVPEAKPARTPARTARRRAKR